MKKHFILASVALSALIFSTTACKKTDNPAPDEQELITTAKLTFISPDGTQTFSYKVDNGFNAGGGGGKVTIDTIRLKPNTEYSVAAQILNESKAPVEDVTTEILEKQLEHLFLYESTPATGAGSLTFSEGQKDSGGQPLNIAGKFKTGAAGTGSLAMYLIHMPTDKSAVTHAGAGGSTDVQATFPVRLQ
jgi:hypothetical protein